MVHTVWYTLGMLGECPLCLPVFQVACQTVGTFCVKKKKLLPEKWQKKVKMTLKPNKQKPTHQKKALPK